MGTRIIIRRYCYYLFRKNNGQKLEVDFINKFEVVLPEKINERHEIIIVSVELDFSTERIINYLSDNYNIPINAVFFRYFKEGKNEYLSRSWLIDPNLIEEKASKSKSNSRSESWNGRDFVVNIENKGVILWQDCIDFNCVIGGGGKWYSSTLKKLFPGARIFCMIPG
ncbi:MAG: hypothetical protein ACOCRK_08600 [bacterium]